jgi:Bacterial regulatory proteins, luxR family
VGGKSIMGVVRPKGFRRIQCDFEIDAVRFRPTLPPKRAWMEGRYYALPADDAELLDIRSYIATLLRSAVQSNSAAPSRVTCRALSRRETGILQTIANGMSNKRVAQSLGIGPERQRLSAR